MTGYEGTPDQGRVTWECTKNHGYFTKCLDGQAAKDVYQAINSKRLEGPSELDRVFG
ncbi:hypothetical protein ACFL5K_03655 [Gemmatimonadota bacterium]